MQRRDLIKSAVAAPFISRALGANDRIVVGQIGCGGRGTYEMQVCSRIPGVEIAAIADVYDPLIKRGLKTAGPRAEGYRDFRRILDRKDIDAVFVSTPDHWHALATVLACQAGKDVYCEKPLTHNIREGQVMVKAARRYNRVVQTGSQQRSAPHFAKVVELVRGGHIGKVSQVDFWNTVNQAPNGYGKPPDSAPPESLDWDMFLGPAPKVPYNRNRFHFNFRWFWDYANGWMTDWGAHHVDIVHWAMGVDAPLSAQSLGGKYVCDDNTETPDTFTTLLEYPGFLARYTLRTANARRPENRMYGMAFFGTKGTIVVDRSGYEVIPESDMEGLSTDFDRIDAFLQGGPDAAYVGLNFKWNGKLTPRCEAMKETGIKMEPAIQEVHVKNFLDSVRSRQKPVADVEIGHRTVTACHLGVIAYRLGRKIRWDAAAEKIIGDPEAQAMTSRQNRDPWKLPEIS